MGIQQTLFAGGTATAGPPSGTFVGNITLQNLSHIDVAQAPASIFASCQINLMPSGEVQFYNGVFNSPIISYPTVWYSPPVYGIGDSYWVRYTTIRPPLSGGSLIGSDTGWLQLIQTWGPWLSGGVNDYTIVMVEMATDAAGSNIVASANWTLQIQCLPEPPGSGGG